MRHSSTLLPMLLGLLAARGLAPEALDPWRGWTIFKQYVRLIDEMPDPGVSVQISRRGLNVDVFLLRQVVAGDEEWLEPVGGVVCHLTFRDSRARFKAFEAWSFDFPTFERFVDVVEGDPGFVDLLGQKPISSDVYWESA